MSFFCAAGGGSRKLSSGCYNNCKAIVLGIAVFFSVFPLVFNAPAPAPPGRDLEWLSNPCSRQPPIRHGRSAAENQLKIFLQKIEDIFSKEIRGLYNSTEKIKGNCPRINSMLRPIKDAQSFTTASQAFYETLLQFAVFIDKLKDTKINTKSEFNFSKRNDIFIEAKGNLRLVICEFNDTLSRYEKRSRLLNKPKVPKINMKCLPAFMDLSTALVKDIDFFKKLQKFLKQSRRILKKKKNSKNVNSKKGNKVSRRTRN